MNIPDNLLYTKDHEWIYIVDKIATIGITDFAQGELGDIIFIEFPDKGVQYQSGDPIGTIEAVKTVTDIFTPIDGQVFEVNIELENNPDSVNKDPYDKGWIIKLCNISKDVSHLLSASDYKDLIQ